MEKTALYGLMENPERIDDDSLGQLNGSLDKYPYFQTARLLRLKKLQADNHPSFHDELTKTAIFCVDRKRLFYWIKEGQYADFLSEKREASQAYDRTETLLDSFLSNIAREEKTHTTLPDAGENIVSYDYLAYLESEEDNAFENKHAENQLQHHDIIDRFIEKAATTPMFSAFDKNFDTQYPNSDNHADKESDSDDFLTETLARIYIKQKKYEQALTIIKRLSLNFPKKSVYFADQIRFLELLILNEKNKKQS